jgi:hypothetical protein
LRLNRPNDRFASTIVDDRSPRRGRCRSQERSSDLQLGRLDPQMGRLGRGLVYAALKSHLQWRSRCVVLDPERGSSLAESSRRKRHQYAARTAGNNLCATAAIVQYGEKVSLIPQQAHPGDAARRLAGVEHRYLLRPCAGAHSRCLKAEPRRPDNKFRWPGGRRRPLQPRLEDGRGGAIGAIIRLHQSRDVVARLRAREDDFDGAALAACENPATAILVHDREIARVGALESHRVHPRG